MAGVISSRTSFPTRKRDAYGDLLRDSRGLRREQQQARDAWFTGLPWERKDELLFELEVLLKGAACFANPRNHPGPPRRAPIVMQDFRAGLLLARSGWTRIVQLTRILLGDRDRTFVFQRYLETVLPEDAARTRLVRDAMTQDTPEDSLFALRHGFTNLIEVLDGLLRLPRVPFRLFYAQSFVAQREISTNAYFNPLSALEFRPEFDRIPSRAVLDIIASVSGEHAHRLAALTFLSLFRMLRYLRLCESMVRDHGESRKSTGRLYFVLSVLRSDARALSLYLRRRAGSLLAESYEQDLLRTPATLLAQRHDTLLLEGQRLVLIRTALEGIAAMLQLEMRRVFEHELPAPDTDPPFEELRSKLAFSIESLRPALQSAVLSFARSLGSPLDVEAVFDDPAARRQEGERLRRDAWIFQQILRAFLLKARHLDPFDDRWKGGASFAFAREFLSYFSAIGYPVCCASDYPRLAAFLEVTGVLRDVNVLESAQFSALVEEAEALQQFLADLFERLSHREDLAASAFDKRAAAQALRLYVGH